MEGLNRHTRGILDLFARISAIPRPSRREQRMHDWLAQWAGERGLATQSDAVGNLVMRVGAAPGYADAPTIVLQSHMDMVCEKRPDSSHDFDRDPIRLQRAGDWLMSDGTTLGADNGIGMALALYCAVDQDVPHPPLELLFTIDEETGLVGANNLSPQLLAGRILLNLDSEEEGSFTIGCAGGRNTTLELTPEYEAGTQPHAAARIGRRLIVGGLPGGHSGIDIQRRRGNAIGLLARLLAQLHTRGDLRLATIDGGTAHNAIPREASATIALTQDAGLQEAELQAIVDDLQAAIGRAYSHLKAPISITVQEVLPPARVMSPAASARVVDLLCALPDGPIGMALDDVSQLEISCNLARIDCREERIRIVVSQRSSNRAALEALSLRIAALARLAGATATMGGEYHTWQPNHASELLARARSASTASCSNAQRTSR